MDNQQPKKRGRKPKIRTKPKRAPSKYNLFVKEKMIELRSSNLNQKEKMMEVARLWKLSKGIPLESAQT